MYNVMFNSPDQSCVSVSWQQNTSWPGLLITPCHSNTPPPANQGWGRSHLMVWPDASTSGLHTLSPLLCTTLIHFLAMAMGEGLLLRDTTYTQSWVGIPTVSSPGVNIEVSIELVTMFTRKDAQMYSKGRLEVVFWLCRSWASHFHLFNS